MVPALKSKLFGTWLAVISLLWVIPYKKVAFILGISNRPDIEIYASIYAYERAFILDGNAKNYYWELRNLATNCSLYRFDIDLPRNRAETPTPGGWLMLKLYLENSSKTTISNLRIGIRDGLLLLNVISCTPNIQASLKREISEIGGLTTLVIMVPTIPPEGKAVINLKSSIDGRSYKRLHHQPLSISCPFLTSNEFRIAPKEIKKYNAWEMGKLETKLATGEATFPNEKIEYRLLRADEPDFIDRLTYERIPPAKKCSEGTGGKW